MAPRISLLVALALFCTLSVPTLAAPHNLLPADLAAVALSFPALTESESRNDTDTSWLNKLTRRFELNSAAPFLSNAKGVPANAKSRSVPPTVYLKGPASSTIATVAADPPPTTSSLSTSTKVVVVAPTTTSTPSTTSKASTTTTSTSTAAATSTNFPTLGSVPASVNSLYSQLKGGSKCSTVLDTNTKGYGENGNGGNYAHYCGDVKSSPSVVYWMSNMDVDCDGGAATGPCSMDPSHLSETAFTYKNKPIDAQAVPYVVINDDRYFSPSKMGIQGLATVGVVCGGKLTWAVFADTNGLNSMGEASVKLAQTCFGSSMNGNNGHGPADVLYFAFTGADAVDPLGGTNYQSLAARGNALLSRLS